MQSSFRLTGGNIFSAAWQITPRFLWMPFLKNFSHLMLVVFLCQSSRYPGDRIGLEKTGVNKLHSGWCLFTDVLIMRVHLRNVLFVVLLSVYSSRLNCRNSWKEHSASDFVNIVYSLFFQHPSVSQTVTTFSQGQDTLSPYLVAILIFLGDLILRGRVGSLLQTV